MWNRKPDNGNSTLRALALLLLRASLGLLMVFWGLDKLVNVIHGIVVSQYFYFGVITSPIVIKAFGVFETLLGLAVMVGILRRYLYPVMLLVTATTLLGVWKSVVDPWGWIFRDTNVLFYPSLIIFAAVVVLLAFKNADTLVLDRD